MKSLIKVPKYLSLLLITAFLFSGIQAFAEAGEGKVRRYNKSFQVRPDHVLSISNQFGDVDISHWDKKEVKVEIEVLVDYKNEKKGQEMIDKIQIKIKDEANEISLKTVINDKKNDVSIGKNEKMEINYVVYMPSDIQLELENKFGDITLDMLTARAEIELQFGSAKIGKLMHQENELSFKFSDPVIIDELGGGEVDVKFSKLELGNCGDLELKSEMSTTNVGNMGKSEVKVSHGGFNVKSAQRLEMKSSMSTVRIDKLQEGGSIDVGHGKLIIGELSKEFEGLEIDSKFGPVEIGIEQGSKLRLDAENSMSDLNLPSGYEVVKADDIANNESFQGAIGGDGSDLPVLKVSNSFGSTKIK